MSKLCYFIGKSLKICALNVILDIIIIFLYVTSLLLTINLVGLEKTVIKMVTGCLRTRKSCHVLCWATKMYFS